MCFSRNKKMKENIGVLAPGKGWVILFLIFENFKRNKKNYFNYKRISSAKSYLHDQGFVKKFYEIEIAAKVTLKNNLYYN